MMMTAKTFAFWFAIVLELSNMCLGSGVPCQVCPYPGKLTGSKRQGTWDCSLRDTERTEAPLTCKEYWDGQIRHDMFHASAAADLLVEFYTQLTSDWIQEVQAQKTGAMSGQILLHQVYDDSRYGNFESQTTALDFLVALTHFGNQHQPSESWPPLHTSISFDQVNWVKDSNGNIETENSNVIESVITPGLLDVQMIEESGGAWFQLIVAEASSSLSDSAATIENDFLVRNYRVEYPTAVDLAEGSFELEYGLPIREGTKVENIVYSFWLTDVPIQSSDIEKERIQHPLTASVGNQGLIFLRGSR